MKEFLVPVLSLTLACRQTDKSTDVVVAATTDAAMEAVPAARLSAAEAIVLCELDNNGQPIPGESSKPSVGRVNCADFDGDEKVDAIHISAPTDTYCVTLPDGKTFESGDSICLAASRWFAE